MSFDLSGLPAYVDQSSTELISKALLKPASVNNLTILAGKVAGTSSINLLNSNPYIIDATCGFGVAQTGPGGATGNTTVFDQIDLVVQAKMLKEQLCADALYETYLTMQLTPSAYHEDVPFSQQIIQNKIDNISQYVEQTIWSGDGGNLDGLLSQATVANGCISATGAGITVPFVKATAFASMWGIISKLSNALKQENDLVAYMSYTNYQVLVQAIMAEGNSLITQYPNIANGAGEIESSFIFPGTKVKVFAAPGISSNSHIILGPKKYIYFGTGLMDDADRMRAYYEPATDTYNLMAKFKLGTAVYASQFASTV
jgi:hypothetical protein